MPKMKLLIPIGVIMLIVGLYFMFCLFNNTVPTVRSLKTGLCVSLSGHSSLFGAKHSPLTLSMKSNSKTYRNGDRMIFSITLKNNGKKGVEVPKLALNWKSLIFTVDWDGQPATLPCFSGPVAKTNIGPDRILRKQIIIQTDRSWVGKRRMSIAYNTGEGWIWTPKDVEFVVR